MKPHRARNSYLQVATQTASGGQLVLMLYDGAIRFLEASLAGFEREDCAEFHETIHNNLVRAQAVVQELNLSLNLREGGELARHLRQLYDHIDYRLDQANARKEPEGIQDALRRLTVLRDAWHCMLQSQPSASEACADPLTAAI